MKRFDFIGTNKNFQSSINISFDFGSPEKVQSLIPTNTVCRYLEEILEDVMAPSRNRAKSLVAPYGTGKSHITLAAVSSMWIKDSGLYDTVINAYQERGSRFADDYAAFVHDGPRILPVIISGSSADLRHSLLSSLRSALRMAGLEQIMPQTNFDGALRSLERWESHYPETLHKFELETGRTAHEYASLLRNMDTHAYDEFVKVYPQLTAGSTFDVFDDADVLGVYDKVLHDLHDEGINGLYVVYDEFSKYLEANITSATVEDIKLLQDFAEKCSRSTQDMQLHLLLISHKTLSNYIDSKLPKNKRDGWNGVSGRFKEIEIHTDANQAYELISHAITKSEPGWSKWINIHNDMLEAIKSRYSLSKSSDLLKGIHDDCLIYGCYPLHPVSACLLPKLSSKVAQNERTLFTFLCSDEELSFRRALEVADLFVSPDAIFDYFEPLIRKEYYTSDTRQVYSLARKALDKISEGGLCEKIIKTIALIRIVQQYRLVEPTRQTIIDVYCDCGYEPEEVNRAIALLIESESIVYLKESNGYLRLKESSGVNVEQTITERSDYLLEKLSPTEILNNSQLMNALYPSRYNEEHSIVRYFDCHFLPVALLSSEGALAMMGDGDGAIFAAFPKHPDEMATLEERACAYTRDNPMRVVVIPKEYSDIQRVLYRYEAAKELRQEAIDDQVLKEEYELVVDDYCEIINDYVSGYFRPELRKSRYFEGGREIPGISRRRILSDLLSDLCERTYPYTPTITHETLNKNTLTGAGLSSRSKLLTALCTHFNEPYFGLIGSGQEVAMARSALLKTGIIDKLENPVLNLDPDKGNVKRVLDHIRYFIQDAGGDTFDKLYNDLMGLEYKIGMKRGPIPIYLALVLRELSNEVIIEHKGEEKPFDAALLRDIDFHPADYSIRLMNWTEEKATYVSELATLFSCAENADRAVVANTVRMWFVGLPQITRNSAVNHTGRKDIDFEKHRAFFDVLKKPDIDSNQLLFEKIPSIFGAESVGPDLISMIIAEKEFADNYVSQTITNLAVELKRLINPDAHEDSSLCSIIRDWEEGLSDKSKTYVFSGHTNRIVSALNGASNDDAATVQRVAKAATTLRVEDWKDARFADFENSILSMKKEIEAVGNDDNNPHTIDGQLSIKFFEDEKETVRTFESVEYSRFAKMLKRNLDSCLEDMGGAVNIEQKRQVVFDVLRSLC